MSSSSSVHLAACPNCGSRGVGAFCPACGQAAADAHAPTVGHFAHELLHEVAHVDGKLFRTVRALLISPGTLTQEYWAGHVVSWIRPIRIFLVAAAIHLFFATGIGPVNFNVLVEQEANGAGRNVIVAANPRTLSGRNGRTLAPEAEQHALLEHFGHAYNAVRYLSPLFFALASWLLYRRLRPFVISHLILALHFYSFWYLLATISGLLARPVPPLRGLVALSAVYLAMALRRLFKQGWAITLVKTVALAALLLAIEGGLAYAAITWAERAMHY